MSVKEAQGPPSECGCEVPTVIRRSLLLSFAQRYCELAINAASIVVLARLLTPTEMGLYAVGAAVVALAQVLRDFGVSNYIIQERDLTAERLATAFTCSLSVSWTIGGLLIWMRAPFSRFYVEPALQDVLLVLSVNFFLIPFSAPILSVLRRQMAFGRLCIIGIVSVFAQAGTAVGLAIAGHGYMSLAWGAVVGAAVTAVAANSFRSDRSSYRLCLREWRRVASFGMVSCAADAVSQIGNHAPDFILGRLIGFTAVGVFGRASGLIQMFNQTVMHAVMPVMLPVYSDRIRLGKDVLNLYLNGISYVTVLAWPFFIFLGLMAAPIVRIAFGDQWGAAVPIVQILCLAGIFRPLFYFAPPVLIALGKIKEYFKINATANGLAVVLISGGALHSLELAALSPTIVCMTYFFHSFVSLKRFVGLSFGAIARSLRKSVAVSGICSLVPLGFSMMIDFAGDNIWWPFTGALFGTASLWLCLIFTVDHPISKEVRSLWVMRGSIWSRFGSLSG